MTARTPTLGPHAVLAKLRDRRPDLVPASALLVHDFAAEGRCGGGLKPSRPAMLGEHSCQLLVAVKPARYEGHLTIEAAS